MENWKALFRERFVIEENTEEQYLRKYDHRTIVEELEHFISQELSKTREEGVKEGIEIYSRYMELREKEKHTYFEDKDVDELNELELLISKLKM